MQFRPSALRHGIVFGFLLGLLIPRGALCENGTLAIYSDRDARDCALAVPPGTTRNLFVVFVPEGATRSGIVGAEFRLDVSAASGYLMLSVQPLQEGMIGFPSIGDVLSGGATVAWAQCSNSLAIPLLQVQVMNLGAGAPDATLHIRARSNPSNASLDCPLITLCDAPHYSGVCIFGGVGVLNATSDVACGSGAQKKQWTGVKALYR